MSGTPALLRQRACPSSGAGSFHFGIGLAKLRRYEASCAQLPVYRMRVRAWFLAGLLLATGCGPQVGSLKLSALAPHSVTVAQEVVIPLLADGTGLEPLTWQWRSLTNPELTTRLHRPTLSAYSGGRALWRFTPLASDVGPQSVEFSAESGALSGSIALGFVIEPGGDPPLFREPVGEGDDA